MHISVRNLYIGRNLSSDAMSRYSFFLRLAVVQSILLLLCSVSSGQTDSLLRQGMRFHDEGKFREALECYQKVLESDPTNAEAMYEMAYTFMSTGDYKRAAAYAKNSIRKGKTPYAGSYAVWGSSLDELGQREKALKVFDEGMKYFPEDHLLAYNKGLTLYRMKRYREAEQILCRSVRLRPSHPGSHLLLAYTEAELGNRVKAMFPLYFFLLIESRTERSKTAWEMLASLQVKGMTSDRPGKISASMHSREDSDSLGVFEMTVSMAAVASIAGKTDSTELGRFAERNRTFFLVLSEIKKNINSLWWNFYIPFLSEVYTSGNAEAFSYYISRGARPEEAEAWFAKNPDKMNRFADWFGQQQYLR